MQRTIARTSVFGRCWLHYDFDAVFVFHGSHVTQNARTKLEKYLNFKEHYRQSLFEERG